jgi:hypothetical protein
MANLIDQDAYRRHTAKEFHPHLAHFDAELERLIRRSPAHRSMVENPFAMFSITHAFPVVHLVAMCRNGGWIYYPAPQTMYTIRDGHRTVSSSGGETRGAQPIIRFEIVTDQVLVPSKEKLELFKSAGASAPEFRTPFEAVAKPAQLFSAPLAILKKGTAGRFRQPFSLYQHVFGGGARVSIRSRGSSSTDTLCRESMSSLLTSWSRSLRHCTRCSPATRPRRRRRAPRLPPNLGRMPPRCLD